MYYRPLSTVFFPLCKHSHAPESHSRSPSTPLGKNRCSSACPRCMCHCVDKAHCDTETLAGHSSDLQTQSSTELSYKCVWHETLTQQVFQDTNLKHNQAFFLFSWCFMSTETVWLIQDRGRMGQEMRTKAHHPVHTSPRL